jgi:hypothetical protein
VTARVLTGSDPSTQLGFAEVRISSSIPVTIEMSTRAECLDDYVTQDNPVRVIEVFIDELDLGAVGFAGVVPEATERPPIIP